MSVLFWAVVGGFILDLLIGDPRWLPHPVVGMGKVIAGLEKIIRKLTRLPWSEKLGGALLVVIMVSGTYLLAGVLLQLGAAVSPLLTKALAVVMVAATLATRSLAAAGQEIYQLLQSGDLTEARRKVGWIVGRDTQQLPEPEIVRATVETVAENLVDAVISPLFYAVLGGAPLALVYRAINTMDSMVGYKNARYRYFGWAAARLDDVANYIPARITGLILICVSFFMGLGARAAWQAIRRDAPQHPSPNSGISEAAVAGALGVQLGGTNYYQGAPAHRARMGPGTVALQREHIRQVINLMYASAMVAFVIGTVIVTIEG